MSSDGRKLRPIYDAIDVGNYKKALKSCNQLLAKSPFPLAKALKVIVLTRLRRYEEADSLCSEVLQHPVTDIDLLFTLSAALGELGRGDDAHNMFVSSRDSFTNESRVVSSIFAESIRRHDFSAAQQISMQLLRLSRDQRYMRWSAACNALQGIFNNDARMRLLATAQLRKFIDSENGSTQEVLRLLLSLLICDNKIAGAIELLESEKAKNLFSQATEGERIRYIATLKAATGNTDDAAEHIKTLISEAEPNDISLYNAFLDAISGKVPRDKVSQEILSDEMRDRLSLSVPKDEVLQEKEEEYALAFFREMQEQHPTLKGPFLAEVELLKRQQRGSTRASEILEILFDKYGDRPGFRFDFQAILPVLSQDEAATVTRKMLEKAKSLSLDSKKNVLILGNSLLCRGLRSKGDDGDLAELRQLSADFYSAANSIAEATQSLRSSERRVDDDIATAIIACALREKSVSAAKHAVEIAEKAHQLSPHNTTITLSLVVLYSSLGCFSLSYKYWKSLHIKEIQLDSMGHWIISRLSCSLHQENHSAEEIAIRGFHNKSRYELSQMVSFVFERESYAQATEFVRFSDKVLHSHQLPLALVEQCLVSPSSALPGHQDHDLFVQQARFALRRAGNIDEIEANFDRDVLYLAPEPENPQDLVSHTKARYFLLSAILHTLDGEMEKASDDAENVLKHGEFIAPMDGVLKVDLEDENHQSRSREFSLDLLRVFHALARSSTSAVEDLAAKVDELKSCSVGVGDFSGIHLVLSVSLLIVLLVKKLHKSNAEQQHVPLISRAVSSIMRWYRTEVPRLVETENDDHRKASLAETVSRYSEAIDAISRFLSR